MSKYLNLTRTFPVSTSFIISQKHIHYMLRISRNCFMSMFQNGLYGPKLNQFTQHRISNVLQRHLQTSATPTPSLESKLNNTEPKYANVNQPTTIPRPQLGSAAEWNASDVQEVKQALVDAKKAVSKDKIDSQGYILLGKSREELQELFAQYDEKKYRADQTFQSLLKGARKIDELRRLPKMLRQQLTNDGVKTGRAHLHDVVVAKDGTQKVLLQLFDGRVVEAVGIPADEARRPRLTVCVSSQVGCPMRCQFCATGKGGFSRNLMAHEIIDQVLTIQELFQRRVSNIVFMGMGEPLLNIPSVFKAYEYFTKDMEISARHITISTVGVPNAMSILAGLNLQCTLAVSLHASSQEQREKIVPSAKAYPLPALMRDCQEYMRYTGRRVTFEYVLLHGVNDRKQDAQRMVALLKTYGLGTHLNIIPWNPVDESDFKRPDKKHVMEFEETLLDNGLNCTVRSTRGLEAAAACGQLRNEFQKKPVPEYLPLP